MPETKHYLILRTVTTGTVCPRCDGSKEETTFHDTKIPCRVCRGTGKFLFKHEEDIPVEIDLNKFKNLGILK